MTDKRVLVVGLARSGIAVARLLLAHGAQVRINDMKTEAELGSALDPLRGLQGLEWRLGEPAANCLDGIDMLLISPGVPIDNPAVLKARELNIEVTGELEMALRLCLGKLIAITGTNGKTTTTTLVGEIMKNAGRRTYVVGNIGAPVSAIANDTRPDDLIVCEVSSFQLETVSEFKPDISAILNITEDHLYRHKTMENYIAHKARVFMNQGEGDSIVLNYDDETLRAMQTPLKARKVWFSRTQVPPFGAFVVEGQLVFGTKDDYRPVVNAAEIGIKGGHNLENALAATAICMAFGIPAAVIRHTLRLFGGVEHRLEFVRELDGVNYINDSKGTNVDSTLKAIDAMDRDTVILLGGQNHDADFTRLGEAIAAAKRIKGVVLLGEQEDDLARVLDAAGVTDYARSGYDLDRAIANARRIAEPGWNILLSPACKSFDMFHDFEERGRAFKEKVHAL